MTKKILNTDAITNELEGASLFFSKQPVKKERPSLITTDTSPQPDHPEIVERNPVNKKKKVLRKMSKHASTHASKNASTPDNLIETIRKTVKQIGKETVFLRLTTQEKRDISAVVYSLNEIYSGEIRKTTENQIGRIGLNFLLEDFKERGENSILASVIKALNA